MSEHLRIALLTYSTRPRGGVVHTLALAEALPDRTSPSGRWAEAVTHGSTVTSTPASG